MRQSSIINIKDYEDNCISIIGCGAIGSYVATSLAKLGLKHFELWDFDTVEEHNLPNQFFFEDQIGMPKVDATALMMRKINSNVAIVTHNEKFEKHKKLSGGIVIASVDSMSARKEIFEYCKKHTDSITLYIDTRMGGLEGQIYFIDMENKEEIENYERGLFTDEQAVRQRCTERAIIYTVLGMSSFLCCNLVKAILQPEQMRNYIVCDFKEIQVI
jgi:molybdopterin/thiamine biosynthesis adenylyltransferase